MVRCPRSTTSCSRMSSSSPGCFTVGLSTPTEASHGRDAGRAACDDLGEYADDAAAALGGFIQQSEDRGTRFGFVRTAAHGAAACRHWWSHPQWPDLVDRFLRVIEDPADEHWGPGGEWRTRLLPEPAGGGRPEIPEPDPAGTAVGAESGVGVVGDERGHWIPALSASTRRSQGITRTSGLES